MAAWTDVGQLARTMNMDALLTLAATLVGAGIAFLSQWLFEKRRRDEQLGAQLLEQSALLLTLNDDFENRLWEERSLKLKKRVDEWDLVSSRIAKSKLEILSNDKQLNDALARLHLAGVVLGAYWRQGDCDKAILEEYVTEYRSARLEFLEASSIAIRKVAGVPTIVTPAEIHRQAAADVAKVLWHN